MFVSEGGPGVRAVILQLPWRAVGTHALQRLTSRHGRQAMGKEASRLASLTTGKGGRGGAAGRTNEQPGRPDGRGEARRVLFASCP